MQPNYDQLGVQSSAFPQVETIRRITDSFCGVEGIIAVWIGGSFARGAADKGSDIDMRVAFSPDTWQSWKTNPSQIEPIIGNITVVNYFDFGETILAHCLLSDGTILDFFMQSTEQPPPQDATLVLACSDNNFAAQLAEARLPDDAEQQPAMPDEIRQLISSFWLNSHKHAKVLRRGLGIIAITGIGHERNVILRLWYAAATGYDSDPGRGTIHSLTRLLTPIRETFGNDCLECLGPPLRTKHEMEAAIEANRDVVAKVGRLAADRLGFEYPYDAENIVRTGWKEYLRESVD